MRFHHPIIDGFMPYKPPPWKPPPWHISQYRISPLLLTIAILLAFTKTTTNNIISTLDVYPLRIFLSDKHFYYLNFALITLPSIIITLPPFIPTLTRENTFSYQSNFAITNQTLWTNETDTITLTSTTQANNIRDDIIHSSSTSQIITLLSSISTCGHTFHYPFKYIVTNLTSMTTETNISTLPSTSPAIDNRGDTIHSSTQLVFTTNQISYSTITSINTLLWTATIWNILLYNTTESIRLSNNINTTPTDNYWHTYSDNYYLNDHSSITTNIGNATYQISSNHAIHLLSLTILPQFRLPNFSNFPTTLTFRNTFADQNFYTVPSRQIFSHQTFHTNIPKNFLVSSLLLLPKIRNSFSSLLFSKFQPSDATNTTKQHHNSPITSLLYSELLYDTMPNYPSPRLSNIINTSQRASTHASRGDVSTINNPTSSPTNINHPSYRSSNRADSPTYSNIVQNITTTISPFTSNTTMGLSDATITNLTTTTSPPNDNNNNTTAEDNNHNTTVLPPSKPSTVPTLNDNYYHGLFDDDDYDDFDNDADDDDRPLTQFDSALPPTHNYQHPTKRTTNNNINPTDAHPTDAHQHTNNNTKNPNIFMTVPHHGHDIQYNPHFDTTSHSPNYKDIRDTSSTSKQPNDKSNFDK